jgi:hypothetical protein
MSGSVNSMLPKELLPIIGEYSRPTMQQFSDSLTLTERFEACKILINSVVGSGASRQEISALLGDLEDYVSNIDQYLVHKEIQSYVNCTFVVYSLTIQSQVLI